jgi:hypothetical protein
MTSERRSDKKKKKALIHDGRSSTIAMPSDIGKNPVHIPFRLDPIDCFPPICPRSAMNACIPMMAKFLKNVRCCSRTGSGFVEIDDLNQQLEAWRIHECIMMLRSVCNKIHHRRAGGPAQTYVSKSKFQGQYIINWIYIKNSPRRTQCKFSPPEAMTACFGRNG